MKNIRSVVHSFMTARKQTYYTPGWFDKPFNRRKTFSVKWDREKNIQFPMDVADMDYRSPKSVSSALVRRAKHPAYGYTMEYADDAIEKFMLKRHRLYTRDRIFPMANIRVGLAAAIRALTYEDDQIIIMPPVYGAFRTLTEENGRKPVLCELQRDAAGTYSMDFDRIRQAVMNGAKMVLLCSPHNPVGRIWTKEELEKLADICSRHQAMIIADETYMDLTMTPDVFFPLMNLDKAYQPYLVSFFSPGKTFNMAGMHIAYGLCENETVKTKILEQLHAAGGKTADVMGLAAAQAAYSGGEKWLDALEDYLSEGFAIFAREMKEKLPKAILTRAEAGYYQWVDLSAYGKREEEMLADCMREGLALIGGSAFGQDDNRCFARLNLACRHQMIPEAVEKLAKVFGEGCTI